MELKPCPFCGSEAELRSDFKDPVEPDRCQTALIRCVNIKCLANSYIADSCTGETEKTAVGAWNKRANHNRIEIPLQTTNK